jgi:heme oxygenase
MRLRQETALEHRAVEDALPLMREDLRLEQYTACLQRIYGFVSAWEQSSTSSAPAWMLESLLVRSRLSLLERDLRCFKLRVPQDCSAKLPIFASVASLFGGMYVMEGSTLGGQLIARHVETVLHLEKGRGNCYFRGHGEQTGSMWQEFCLMLKATIPDENTELVVDSAKRMFVAYGEWMAQPSAGPR